MQFGASLGLFVLACGFPAHAAEIVLLPSETLEIQFTVSPVNGFTPNVIALGIEGTGGVITNPPIQFTSELFNGTALLGTNVSQMIANSTFGGLDATAWGSTSGTLLQATQVDFSSILDDTIAGIIDTTVNTPITVFDPGNFVIALYSCTTGCFSPGEGVTITSVEVIAPEPSTLILMGAGLTLLLGWRRRAL